MPDGHSGRVRQDCGRIAAVSDRAAGLPCWPDADHTHHLDAAVACDSSGTGPCPAARHASCHVRGATTGSSRVHTGGRWANVGRTSVRSIRSPRTPSMVTGTNMATCAGHSPSGRRSFRKQRTVNPLIPAGSLQLSLLILQGRPAGGRRRRPSSAGRATINEPRFTHAR
jgi:hypothetical protein